MIRDYAAMSAKELATVVRDGEKALGELPAAMRGAVAALLDGDTAKPKTAVKPLIKEKKPQERKRSSRKHARKKPRSAKADGNR